MLQFDSKIVGKEIGYGYLRDHIIHRGFTIGGNWEYHKGSFDAVLWRGGGETIYLRVPFIVTAGELDNEDAQIRFQKPFVIKHVANVGLDYDEGSLLEATGASQFQTPLDKDGHIHDKSRWIQAGEQVVEEKVLPFFIN
ncbi:YugN family protein [Lysinibacillus sp. FSL R7-0073]|uniref:YugN-like family protein n=1 Tax=Lysinibacillus fusiformis TaxID=28031 RepID=A0A1E4RA41_9BACI|nr:MULTISPECIES: YugN family protein [Lysinibacillus]HBJ02758.1 hypothetical protein [Lysinibacillus sp.]MBD8522271.1 hypothetical protein [Lysinibacillus fusiformis]MCR8852895.1 YugN-like family protein [Lysinibacillus fusiformis]MED4888773.1 YugN family protein [Lysinibacillus fusiformis]ODV57334.1 hypothetical protein BG258_16155 [Lysinibacillus fusiformis]